MQVVFRLEIVEQSDDVHSEKYPSFITISIRTVMQ